MPTGIRPPDEGVLPRWSKVETLVRVLAAHAVTQPDVQEQVRAAHALWLAMADAATEEEGYLAADDFFARVSPSWMTAKSLSASPANSI